MLNVYNKGMTKTAVKSNKNLLTACKNFRRS